MTLPVDDIAHLIPQKAPFVLISRLLQADQNNLQSSFQIPHEHPLVNNGVLTDGGLLENMAQTAAAGAGYLALSNRQPVKAGYIAAVKNFEVSTSPEAGDELLTEVRIDTAMENMSVVTGKVMRAGQVIAQCTMTILISE